MEGRGAVAARRAARARAEVPASRPCGLVLFVHIERTGGTWIREQVVAAEKRHRHPFAWRDVGAMGGPCAEAKLRREHWSVLLDRDGWPQSGPTRARLRQVLHSRLRTECGRDCSSPKCEMCCANASLLPPLNSSRFFLEFHSHNWAAWKLTAPLLISLRRLYRARGCSFTAFTILRHPIARALSHWHYLAPSAEPLRRFAELHADAMLRRLLMLPRTGQLLSKQARAQCDEPAAVTLAKAVLSALDVVGVHERMDAALVAVGRHSGLIFPPFHGGRSRPTRASHYTPATFDHVLLRAGSGTRRAALAPSVQSSTPNEPNMQPSIKRHAIRFNTSEALGMLPNQLLRLLNATNLCDMELYRYALNHSMATSH